MLAAISLGLRLSSDIEIPLGRSIVSLQSSRRALDELAKGGYFDWKTIENGQSSFIDKYFDKKRDNIVGDNS